MTKNKRQKIVLCSSNTRYIGAPIGLLAIASLLDRKKYDIKIITKNEYPDLVSEVISQCEGALCLGISTITGFPVKVAKQISTEVKKKYPDLPIIWGGWQPTTLPEETLKAPYVNYICMGQGERTFKEFIDTISSGNLDNLKTIIGLGYKAGKKIYINERRVMEDMNNFPDFDMDLVNWHKYSEVTDFGKKVIRINTSYGCPYRCGFCCEPFNAKRQWKALSATRVIRFIKKLKRRINFDGLTIVDDNFFINEQRVADICEDLIKNKIKVKLGQVSGRTNNLVKYKESTWKLMKKAGLYNILIGAESGNEETLKFINKDATVEDTLQLAKICNKYGIRIVASTIIGLPTAKYFSDNVKAFDEDLAEILDLYNQISKAGINHHLLTFPYAPLPFSPLYEKSQELGFKPPKGIDSWSNYELTSVHVPWIPQTGFKKVEVLNYIAMVVGIDYKYLLGSVPKYMKVLIEPLLNVFKIIGRLRFKYKFLDMPVDMWLFNGGARTFISVNKKYKIVNIGG